MEKRKKLFISKEENLTSFDINFKEMNFKTNQERNKKHENIN